MAQAATGQQIPFSYEGVDKKGKEGKRPRSCCLVEVAARTDLRKQGVIPRCVRKESQLLKSGKRATTEDISLFARQLATMLQAGIPMVQAFDIVGTGHDKPAMQKLILGIKGDIEAGTSLHEALAKQPLDISMTYSSIWSKRVNTRARWKRCWIKSPPTKKNRKH